MKESGIQDECCKCDPRYGCIQENKERGNWLWWLQATLALIGAATGLSNVWNFHYWLVTHSIVFLIPYTVFMILLALPLMYYGMSMGQFTSSGILTCWMIPIGKVIGIAILAINLPTAELILGVGSWAAYYLYECIKSLVTAQVLPWSSLEYLEEYNPECANKTLDIINYPSVDNCDVYSGTVAKNGVCWEAHSAVSWDPVAIYNVTEAKVDSSLFSNRTTEDIYFFCHFLGNESVSTNPIGLHTAVLICLIVLWVMVFVGTAAGVKSIGMVSMITVPLTLTIMVWLTVVASTTADFGEGLNLIFAPDYRKLTGLRIWQDAAVEVFFTSVLMTGIYVTYASYNRFHTDFIWDIGIVSLVNYAANVVFSLMVAGFLARSLADSPVNSEVSANSSFPGVSNVRAGAFGVQVAFASLPAVFENATNPKLTNLLFFLMLVLMTCHYVFALTETLITALLDQFPRLRRLRPLVALTVCVVCFLLGIPMCTNSGWFWYQLVINNISSSQLYVFVILAVICFILYAIYSGLGYRYDVSVMTRWHCCCFPASCTTLVFTITLFITIPISLFLLVLYGINFTPLVLLDSNKPPYDAALLQFLVILYPYVVLVLAFIILLIIAGVQGNLRALFRTSEKWRPALEKHAVLVSDMDDTPPGESDQAKPLFNVQQPDYKSPRNTAKSDRPFRPFDEIKYYIDDDVDETNQRLYPTI